jgi:hypothetical protein
VFLPGCGSRTRRRRPGRQRSQLVLTTAAQVPHPVGSSLANVHACTAYAATSVESYTTIHLAQFTREALLMLRLLVLFFALNLPAGRARLVGILGAVSAGAVLALSAVVTAVDAVGLKQAVDAWASAAASSWDSKPNRRLCSISYTANASRPDSIEQWIMQYLHGPDEPHQVPSGGGLHEQHRCVWRSHRMLSARTGPRRAADRRSWSWASREWPR